MTESSGKSGGSVHIGGNVEGAAIVVGDANTVTVNYEKIELPPAESVDILKEVASLRDALGGLGQQNEKKIGNALADVEDELAREEPDRDEVGAAIERALGYAEKAGDLAGQVSKIAPHVKNVVAWLGESWYKLLPIVGLAL